LKQTLTIVLLLLLTACSTTQTTSNSNQPSQPAPANQPIQPTAAATPVAALQEGEASGTIVDEGQTITLNMHMPGMANSSTNPQSSSC
jgi:uncharacterized lipoprotein YajG